MPTWPITLPQSVEGGGTETLAEQALRAKVGKYGLPKATQLSNMQIPSLHGEMIFTIGQKTTFDTFYRDDIADGALSFDGDLCHRGTTWSYKFIKPPRFRSLGEIWMIEVELMIRP